MPAFIAVTVIAVCLTMAVWVVPGWRHRHLPSGATMGLILLVVTTLLVFGGLDYQVTLPCSPRALRT